MAGGEEEKSNVWMGEEEGENRVDVWSRRSREDFFPNREVSFSEEVRFEKARFRTGKWDGGW